MKKLRKLIAFLTNQKTINSSDYVSHKNFKKLSRAELFLEIEMYLNEDNLCKEKSSFFYDVHEIQFGDNIAICKCTNGLDKKLNHISTLTHIEITTFKVKDITLKK